MAYEEFRQWLQEEMERRGWTFTELSRRSKITASHLIRVASGERVPGAKTCIGIAHAFNIPDEEVLRRAGLIHKTQGAIEGMGELQAYYRGLSPGDRRRLLAIARVLLEESH